MNEKQLNDARRDREYRIGMICVIASGLFWGLCPIYWHALEPIPSWIIVLYRIFTMFIYTYIAARSSYSKAELWGPFKDKKIRRKYIIAGLILASNWSIYIWAMTSEHVIQASIGYYIEPLVICAVGIIFFKEKVTRYNLTAMAFALVSIIIILIHFGQIPGVALGLAGTWAIYSAIKKTSEIPVLIALVYETMVYAVLALIAIIYIEMNGTGALILGVPGKYAMMLLSGLITLIPVALFSVSAKKVSLLVIGLTQYISPTITLLLGIFLFKEPIDLTQIISFAIIWIGLTFFTYGEFMTGGKSEK